mgnify:CR=1 FL=1
MTSPQRLTAIVVTYNRLEALQTTLARLLAHDAKTLSKLIVCNNASTDGTDAYLATLKDPRLTVLTLPTNTGGAGGFEAALRHAEATEPSDWYVLMDDDAFPDTGALARFHAAPRDDHDVWLSAVRYPNGRICEMNKPWRNPFWSLPLFGASLLKGRNAFHIGPQDYAQKQPLDVDGGSFVGQFISRRAISKAGFPRGELFIYADDVLFTLAVRQAGGRVGFDPRIAFVHDCETLSESDMLISPLWKVYFYHRNVTLVYRKVAGPVLFWPLIALKAVSWHKRARLYGAERPLYLRLLKLALSDALGKRVRYTAADIKALISPQEHADDSGAKAPDQTP